MTTNVKDTRYGLRVEIPVSYERAVEQATAALKEQGFGVLTTIDVQQTLKQKLDRDFRKYVILGACNPPLADRALRAELEIGASPALQRHRVRSLPGHERRGGHGAGGSAGPRRRQPGTADRRERGGRTAPKRPHGAGGRRASVRPW